ncbi:MAG: RidA family protein [Deltaproteobacteria bacterium]|nr:MAG: RidA family protein [Deltaproteobacteria bacterium]
MRHQVCFLLVFSLLIALLGCTTSESDKKTTVEYLNSPGIEKFDLPFSEAVRVNNMLYLSGQVGNMPGQMKLVEGGIEEETRQTLENIKSTLQRYGADMDDVVKCTVFLADIAEWPRMNKVYKTYFNSPFPARSAVAGSGLALGARVEIECIAVLE